MAASGAALGFLAPPEVLPATFTAGRAIAGGLLVGLGAALGNGCTSGTQTLQQAGWGAASLQLCEQCSCVALPCLTQTVTPPCCLHRPRHLWQCPPLPPLHAVHPAHDGIWCGGVGCWSEAPPSCPYLCSTVPVQYSVLCGILHLCVPASLLPRMVHLTTCPKQLPCVLSRCQGGGALSASRRMPRRCRLRHPVPQLRRSRHSPGPPPPPMATFRPAPPWPGAHSGRSAGPGSHGQGRGEPEEPGRGGGPERWARAQAAGALEQRVPRRRVCSRASDLLHGTAVQGGRVRFFTCCHHSR